MTTRRRRPDWSETWMGVALVVAQRSPCVLFQAGCVIVDATNRVVATGYNGGPAGMASERWIGQGATCQDDCPRGRGTAERGVGYGHSCISIHAEANALLFCDRKDREGGTLYVNGVSCEDCQKLIANSGVARVVMLNDDRPNRPARVAVSYLRRCGIDVRTIPKDWVWQ